VRRPTEENTRRPHYHPVRSNRKTYQLLHSFTQLLKGKAVQILNIQHLCLFGRKQGSSVSISNPNEKDNLNNETIKDKQRIRLISAS
jgi:hypothetical protein